MIQPEPIPPDAAASNGDTLARLLREDPGEACRALERQAHLGCRNSQRLLAQMYVDGKGVERDDAAGFHWFCVAANNGHLEAMNMLGRCHELGIGTPANVELAAVWYRKAADGGLDWGMYNHANLLTTGRGVGRDLGRAYALYLRAARMGHAKSMNLVGRFLEEGLVAEADPAAAAAWYRRSAEAGDFRGQASYAAILAECGRLEEAEAWLRRAIPQGSPGFHAHLAGQLDASPHPRLRALRTLVPV